MTTPGAIVTVVHYQNVARWQDCITFYQSRVIQHSPAAKFMCTQSKPINFKADLKIFKAHLMIFKVLKPI